VLVIDGVSRALIEDSYGGAYVQPGDDQQLAETILDLSKNIDIVKQMGLNAREYLVKNLDRRDKLNETLDLLMKLVSK
jgi:glycosyltransferase involved in cell wall biosynthesis